MPTYDYMCDSCGYTFEVQHKMTDDPAVRCPQCGQGTHQVFSAGFGLNFTGKGFYQTDTRKKDVAVNGEKSDDAASSTKKNNTSAHSCGKNCGCSGKEHCAASIL